MAKKVEDDILFSIIVPVYNVEQYIRECIDSVLKQDCRDYEVIMVDDGSTDSSGKICDEYAAKYPFIKAVHQENQGLSGARNTAIRHASGKYLVYLDSDDMIAEGALSGLESAIMGQNEPEIVLSRRLTYKSSEGVTECQYHFNEQELSGLSAAEVFKAVQNMPDMWLGAWVFTVKRDYIRDNDFYFYPGILHEDEEWVPKIFLNARSIGYNNSCVYVNRVGRPGSITATPNIKREFDRLKIIELLQEEFTSQKYSADICEVVAERIRSIYFGILCSSNIYSEDGHFLQLEEQIRAKRELLQSAVKRSHKLGRILTAVVGVKGAGKLLSMIKKVV